MASLTLLKLKRNHDQTPLAFVNSIKSHVRSSISDMELPVEVWQMIRHLRCLLLYYEQWVDIVNHLRTKRNTQIYGHPSKTFRVTDALSAGGFRWIGEVKIFHWCLNRIVMIEFGDTIWIYCSHMEKDPLYCMGILRETDSEDSEHYQALEKLFRRGKGMMNQITL